MSLNIFFNTPIDNLQHIVDSAQAIDINRSKLVATTMARSGRVFVAGRNWVRPWRFTITPQPYWRWEDWRERLEPVIDGDRLEIHEIDLKHLSWAVNYLGSSEVSVLSNQLTGVTVSAVNGNSFTFNVGTEVFTPVFKAGDIFQPAGHKYPYVVSNWNQLTNTATVHRGYIQQTGYDPVGKNVVVGKGVTWQVVISKMPTYRLVPGKLMEFTSDFELIEVIE